MATRQRDEIMRGFFAAMGSSNGAAMADYMSRFGFQQKPPMDFPASQMSSSGSYRKGKLISVKSRFVDVGRTAIGQALLPFWPAVQPWRKLEYTLEHVLEDGDMVAVHATARGTTAIGHQYENEYHFLFRLEGDRIAEGWEFLDTAYVYARNT